MTTVLAGISVRTKMLNVKKERDDLYSIITKAKGVTLDESPDTEDERTEDILRRQDLIEGIYRDASVAVSTSSWKLFRIFPASKTIDIRELSSLLDGLLRQINILRSDVKATNNARTKSGICGDVAFKTKFDDGSSLSRLSSRMSVWILSSVGNDTYQELKLTESDFNAWWYGDSSPSEVSLVWEDLKSLCLKVVSIMDSVNDLEDKDFANHEHLQKLDEDLRTATIKLIELLSTHPSHELLISSIFMHVSVATFAMSKVLEGTENAIQSSIPQLQPVMDKILKLCNETDEQLKQESPNTTKVADMSEDKDHALGKADAPLETFDSEIRMRNLLDSLRRIIQKPKARSTTPSNTSSIEMSHLGLEDLHKLTLHPVLLSTQNPEPIGDGSFSAVYRYYSVDGKKKYVVKRPFARRGDEEFTRRAWNRIIREAHCLVKCAHANVVRLHGYYEIPNFPFPGLVIDEYEMSLKDLISWKKSDTFSVEQRLRILKRVASGLSHVHKNECVHGDLRAANVLVRTMASGTDWFVALADFGVSRVADMQESRFVNTVIKTNESWLAPEYIKSPDQEIQPPADIYAFGCVFVEVLTGKRPYYYAESQRLSIQELKHRRDLPARDDVFGKRKGHYSFIREACAYNPRERPSAEVLIDKIDDLREREALGDW